MESLVKQIMLAKEMCFNVKIPSILFLFFSSSFSNAEIKDNNTKFKKY